VTLFAEILWFPRQGSTTAREVDQLLIALLSVTGAVSLLVAALIIGFSIRYRRRSNAAPPAREASVFLETIWTAIPMAIFFWFFLWGARVYFHAYRPPDDARVVYVTAKQWMWKFQHQDGQREINELHVPVGQPVKLILTSEDVIHSFYVPEFRIHMDVLPGRYTSMWFEATQPETFKLLCSQYCGTNHAGMTGTVVAMKPSDFEEWLRSRAEGSLALQGRKTFLKFRCLSCHSADGQSRAPLLENVFGKRIPLRDGGTALADEDYIRESILNPRAKVVAGYEPIMPTFQGQVTEAEIIELIAFIRALGTGQTPPRVEDFPPPADTPPIVSKESSK